MSNSTMKVASLYNSTVDTVMGAALIFMTILG